MKPIKIIDAKELREYVALKGKFVIKGSEREVERTKRMGEIWGTCWRRIADLVGTTNGRATTHTYTPGEIIDIALEGEVEMERRGVTKANMPGTIINARSDLPTSKAYKRSAIAGFAKLERRAAGWYLVSYSTGECCTGPGAQEKISYTISEAARDDIYRLAMDGITVTKAIDRDTTQVETMAGVEKVPWHGLGVKIEPHRLTQE